MFATAKVIRKFRQRDENNQKTIEICILNSDFSGVSDFIFRFA